MSRSDERIELISPGSPQDRGMPYSLIYSYMAPPCRPASGPGVRMKLRQVDLKTEEHYLEVYLSSLNFYPCSGCSRSGKRIIYSSILVPETRHGSQLSKSSVQKQPGLLRPINWLRRDKGFGVAGGLTWPSNWGSLHTWCSLGLL